MGKIIVVQPRSEDSRPKGKVYSPKQTIATESQSCHHPSTLVEDALISEQWQDTIYRTFNKMSESKHYNFQIPNKKPLQY